MSSNDDKCGKILGTLLSWMLAWGSVAVRLLVDSRKDLEDPVELWEPFDAVADDELRRR